MDDAPLRSAPASPSASSGRTLSLPVRRRRPGTDGGDGPRTRTRLLHADETAVLLCDVWDQHWSRGAAERVAAMAPRIDLVVEHLRGRGVLVVHAPSETLEFYREHPARRRTLDVQRVEPPDVPPLPEPPLPIDDSDGGSDTGETSWHSAWTRQHAAIRIDDGDVISDDGVEIYSVLAAESRRCVLVMGVHTNMCVLRRSFGIRNLVRWGLDTMLVRDLTDAMYNPAMPPHVSHERGTELVVEHIEQHLCPTVVSADLLAW
jgi:nicotinamidase-related amidase